MRPYPFCFNVLAWPDPYPLFYSEIAPEIIEEIKRLRRKPKGKKPMSFNRIAEVLNEKGFNSATGKPFTGNNVSTLFHRIKKK